MALNGPANPLEFASLEAADSLLKPLTDAAGGGTYALQTLSEMPDLRYVGQRGNAAGSNWLGLRERDAYAVRNSTSIPLLPGLLAVLLVLIALTWAWQREGR